MEQNEDIKTVKDIIQAILKSKKMIRMYPANNPIYIKTIEDTYARFKDYFDYRAVLVFRIHQNDITWDDEVIYSNSEKEDNLAMFFFKDGLKELEFNKGLSQQEMEEFLLIIALDFEREAVDDDIVTLLWEKDFQNIRYKADEVILADEEVYEIEATQKVLETTNEQDNILKAYQDAFKEDDIIKDAAIVPLSDKDLQQLMYEIEKDSKNKIAKLIDIIFEIMYYSETRADFEDIAEYFISAIEYSMSHGDIAMIISILTRLDDIISSENVDNEIKKCLKRIIAFTCSDKVINVLGEFLDSSQEMDDKLMEDFVKLLDKSAIMPLMNILGELKSIHARKVVIDALIFLGPKDIITLAKGLNDSRWYVVRNIIYILRKISDKRAVEFLLKTVRHADIRVKKEVIRALGELGGAGVFQTLKECLDDPEEQVRFAALRALGNISSEASKRIIMDRIRDKNFKDRDFEEKKEYFEILSKWKDSEVFAFLVELLRKKTIFFGSAKNDEIRACAAYALGFIGNRNAIPLLNKYKGDGNKLIREFCFSALKRLEHG